MMGMNISVVVVVYSRLLMIVWLSGVFCLLLLLRLRVIGVMLMIIVSVVIIMG